MAEMDEFTGFLVAGLLIMAVLIAAFSVAPFAKAEAPARVPLVAITNRTEAVFVGKALEDAFVPFAFRLSASSVRDFQVVQLGDAEVSNGALFGEKSFTYRAEGEDVAIRFRVARNNGLGAMSVLVEGSAVAEIHAPGDYEFDVPAGLIELRAQSSSWQLWAPNIFHLEAIEVEFFSVREASSVFRFPLSEEQADGFIAGKIDVSLRENTGRLVAALNGVSIFDGFVNDIDTIRFDGRGIREGENVLLVTSGRASRIEGAASLTIFYSKLVDKKAVTPFALTDEEWTKLQEGEVRFIVTNVLEEGGIAVRFLHDGALLRSDFLAAGEGTQRISFDQRHVRPGDNALVIEAINGARFEVADIEILI